MLKHLKAHNNKKLNFWAFFSIVDPDAHVIFGSKMSHLLQTKIFLESHLQTFDLPHDPSRCAAFKKILMAGTEIQGNSDTSILDPKWTVYPQYEYLWKIY